MKDLLKFNKCGVKAVKLENNVSKVRTSDPTSELCIKNGCFKCIFKENSVPKKVFKFVLKKSFYFVIVDEKIWGQLFYLLFSLDSDP